MYFKYKIQNTYMYFKYAFQILVFEILPSTGYNSGLDAVKFYFRALIHVGWFYLCICVVLFTFLLENLCCQ